MSDTAILFAAIAAFIPICAVLVWRNLTARRRALDRVGACFGVIRWDGETNDHFSDRIRNRIRITGGKLSP